MCSPSRPKATLATLDPSGPPVGSAAVDDTSPFLRPPIDASRSGLVAMTWPLTVDSGFTRAAFQVVDPCGSAVVPLRCPSSVFENQDLPMVLAIGPSLALPAFSGPQESTDGVRLSLWSLLDGRVM